MWDKRARLLRVIDGDTIEVLLDQGFRDTKEIDVRLLGVWAPEMREPGGPETKAFVQEWFRREEAATGGKVWSVVVTTMRMPVADKEQQTFDRYVCTVTSMDGSRSLNVAVSQYVAEQGYGGGSGS